MKRMLTYALGAVIAASAVPAMAQDNFPDTQENHWAYEALARMRAAGLLVGYPDGLYRGTRPASRYEMAVALYALYQHLKGIADGLEAQQNALKDQLSRMSTEGFASKEELKSVTDALAQTNAAIAGMKSWGDDIAAIKRATSTFEKELASHGVDIEALKKSVNDLDARVTALENKKMPVSFSGDVNLWMGGFYSIDDLFYLGTDGRVGGVTRDGNFEPAGFGKDLTMGQEIGVNVKGTNEGNWNWWATLVFGNLFESFSIGDGSSFGPLFGNQSSSFAGSQFGEGNWDVYAQTFGVTIDTSLWGQNFKGRFGRVGHKINPMLFWRPDNTHLFKNERWDNGEWYFNGGVMEMMFGSASFTVFGGRQSGVLSTNGVEINPMWAGGVGQPWDPLTLGLTERPRGMPGGVLPIDQHLGATLGFKLGDKGALNVTYAILDSNSDVPVGISAVANRVLLMGGDLSYMFNDNFSFYGGFAQTNLNEDSQNRIDEDNQAMWFGIKFKGGNWNGHLGWKSIDPQYYAPGFWGRIGQWTNPVGLQGINAGADFKLNDRAGLMLSGGRYTGRDITINGVEGFTKDDTVTTIKAKLSYKLNPSWDLMLSKEFVKWDLDSRGLFPGGEPTEKWFSLGLKYQMGENAWWSFLWQVSDYDDDGTPGWTPFGGFGNFGAGKAKGGAIVSQIGIKF